MTLRSAFETQAAWLMAVQPPPISRFPIQPQVGSSGLCGFWAVDVGLGVTGAGTRTDHEQVLLFERLLVAMSPASPCIYERVDRLTDKCPG